MAMARTRVVGQVPRNIGVAEPKTQLMGEHDALFKKFFTVPENAAGELRSVLPPRLVGELDLSRLEVMPGTFVSRELRLRHTDLLVRVPFRRPRGGHTHAYIYVVLEHQSKVDPEMPYRMLEYMVRIWTELRLEDPSRWTLPVVIPLVVHHGARPWSGPRTLHALVEGLDEQPELRRFVPDFELLIDDLAVATDAQLMARPLAPAAQIAAWLLRDGRDVEAILAHLEVWATRLAEVVTQHPDESTALLRYILLAGGVKSLDQVRNTIILHVPAAEAPMASAGEQLIQQGFQLGVQQGVQQGEMRALRDALTSLLEHRFGASEAAMAQPRIEGREASELKRMLLRVPSATTVADVFAMD